MIPHIHKTRPLESRAHPIAKSQSLPPDNILGITKDSVRGDNTIAGPVQIANRPMSNIRIGLVIGNVKRAMKTTIIIDHPITLPVVLVDVNINQKFNSCVPIS